MLTHLRIRPLGHLWSVIPAPPGESVHAQLEAAAVQALVEVPELVRFGLTLSECAVFWDETRTGPQLSVFHEVEEDFPLVRVKPAHEVAP